MTKRVRFRCPLCGARVRPGDATVAHIRAVHPEVNVIAQDMSVERALVFNATQEQLDAAGFEWVPGYPTSFTRREVPGAYANGTRVVKVRTEPGDGRALGSQGVVLGSMVHPDLGIAYFIEWDERPMCAVLVIESKIDPFFH